MKNLGDLFTALGTEAVRRYEAHTGITGLGNLVNPMVASAANDVVGHVRIDPNSLKPVFDLAGLIMQHWERLNQPRTNTNTQSEATPVSRPETVYKQPNIRTATNVPYGSAAPGFTGRSGVRTGRR